MSRTVLVWDPAQGKVVERSEKWIPASSAPYIIGDEIPLTKSPVDGKQYFTSKRELRKHYRAHGVEEIGTSYENEEYIEKAEREYQRELEARTDSKIKQNLIDRVIHGRR